MTRIDEVAVLVVDDDPDLRSITTFLVKRAGATAIEAVSLAEARTMLESHPAIRGAVVDIHLPDGLGTELVEALHGRPALFASAMSPQQAHVRAIELGVAAIETKPLASARLTQFVDGLRASC